MFAFTTIYHYDDSSKIPDSSSLCVVVEHSVLVVPDDVLWRFVDDLADQTLELDRAAALVRLLRHVLVALVYYFDLRN
jgi:hypothetical protein